MLGEGGTPLEKLLAAIREIRLASSTRSTMTSGVCAPGSMGWRVSSQRWRGGSSGGAIIWSTGTSPPRP